MGGWGGMAMKPTVLQCTAPRGAIEALYKSKDDATRKLGDDKTPLTRRTARKDPKLGNGWNKRGWVSANRSAQSQSQIYPAEFCERLALVIVSLLS
eukprot:9475164-Pyramimonas_sp.AAC.1